MIELYRIFVLLLYTVDQIVGACSHTILIFYYKKYNNHGRLVKKMYNFLYFGIYSFKKVVFWGVISLSNKKNLNTFVRFHIYTAIYKKSFFKKTCLCTKCYNKALYS